MHALVREAWRQRGPRVECTVGDLDWRLYRRATVDAAANIRLWEMDGTLVGFAWFLPGGELWLGLARAVSQEALRRLQAAGARSAVISALPGNAASVELYAPLGFRELDRNAGFVRSLTKRTFNPLQRCGAPNSAWRRSVGLPPGACALA